MRVIAENQVAGKKFLLFVRRHRPPHLPQKLKQTGAAAVDDIALYQTQIAKSLPIGLD